MGNTVNIESLIKKGEKDKKEGKPEVKKKRAENPKTKRFFEVFDKLAQSSDQNYEQIISDLEKEE